MFKGSRSTYDLNYLFKISHWLCIQPRVNLQNLKQKPTKCNLIYRVILIAILDTVAVCTLLGRIFSSVYEEYPTTLIVLDIFQQILLFMFNSHYLVRSLFSCKISYLKTIGKLKKFEKYMANKICQAWNVVVKELIFYHCLFVIVLFIEWSYWAQHGFNMVLLFAYEKVEAYYVMIQILLMVNITRTIQQYFLFITCELTAVYNCESSLKKILQKFSILLEVVESFNSYFGFSFACFYLLLLNSFLSTFSFWLFYREIGTLVACAVWFSSFLVSTFLVAILK